MFQSTLPHGERRAGLRPIGFLIYVSIHAPAWGATSPLISYAFNNMFQSTLPHGERRLAKILSFNEGECFNPRSRMGSDFNFEFPSRSTAMFQSTLPHGERLSLNEDTFLHQGVSIHAPAWGATLGQYQLIAIVPVSIHAPAWGATDP